MKVNYKVNEKLHVEFESDTQTDTFEKLSLIQEVFGNSRCGKCDTDDINFQVREVEDNKYYELKCNNMSCRARLAFGCHKKGGTLFPKRKTDDGWLPDNGWLRWDRNQGKEV